MISEIIIILAAIVLVLLLSPISINVNSTRTGGKIYGFFSLRWIIFLFRYAFRERQTEILVFGRRVARSRYQEKPKIKQIEKSGEIKKSRKIPKIEDIFYLSKKFLRLLKDLIHSFRLKYLDINLLFGLKDPAHTGIMTGFLHSILGSFNARHNIKWDVDFTRPVLEWDMKAEIVVMPIKIVSFFIKFLADGKVLSSGFRILRG
jgi:hypothetical protein